MEKIFSAIPYFYGSNTETPNTFRMQIEMKDDTDQRILKKSVETSMKRYPYFAVEISEANGKLYLKDNPHPVTVRNSLDVPILGTEQTNYHLIAVCAAGKKICIDMFHGLADGCGFMPFVKTLLYYYCSEKYGVTIDSAGINLAGDEITEEEIAEPYPDSPDETVKPLGRYQPKPSFQLKSGGKVKSNKSVWYRLSIDENAFMKYSKSHDGSPAAIVTVFLFKVLRELHPDAEQPFVCGMAMNIRPVLGNPINHHSLVSQLFLEYKPQMKKMSTQDMATCCRGMIMLQSQPENILISVNHNIGFFRMLDNLPDLASKQAYMKKIVERSMLMDTFKVSYVGKANLGGMEKYVEAIDSLIDMSGAGIMAEVNAVNGRFNIAFLQEFEEDIYVKEFVRQLALEGIECELSAPEDIMIPGISICGSSYEGENI